MDETRAVILLMEALAGGFDYPPRGASNHVVAILDRNEPLLATSALRTIAHALDWRIDVLDAVRTNLNDLESRDSPLSETVRHAGRSDLRHVIVLQGCVPEMLSDKNQSGWLKAIALHAPLVVCMEQDPGSSGPWTVVDLRSQG